MMSIWVCHKSGQGEKWKVEESNLDKYQDCWVHKRGPDQLDYFLPKSEFIECTAPEVWTECTREVLEIGERGSNLPLKVHDLCLNDSAIAIGRITHNYRWAWRGDALVIERRQR